MNKKQKVKGVILIISCHKHLFTRLQEFGPKQNEYNGWIVHKIIGNPLLTDKYVVNQKTGIITIKCEDSYIYVMKKVVMAIELMFDMYEIEEGVLRCGDDLIFNESILEKFLSIHLKMDYIGNPVRNQFKNFTKKKDNFMVNYYLKNKCDFTHFLHGLQNKEELILKRCNEVPTCLYAGGVVFYVSKNACKILINHMKSIDYDIFKYYTEYGYPYIIEDIAIGFVLGKNKISLTPILLYGDNPSELTIAYHTNKYK